MRIDDSLRGPECPGDLDATYTSVLDCLIRDHHMPPTDAIQVMTRSGQVRFTKPSGVPRRAADVATDVLRLEGAPYTQEDA